MNCSLGRLLTIILASHFMSGSLSAETELPRLEKFLQLLEENLYEFDASAVEEAAVSGLIEKLNPSVSLSDSDDANQNAGAAKRRIFEDRFLYVHLDKPGRLSRDEIHLAFSGISQKPTSDSQSTHQVFSGLVLDLRFSGGHDYDSLPELAGTFLGPEKDIYQLDGNPVFSTASSQPTDIPMAVLVNEETHGASELLAATLKKFKRSISIGRTSSGRVFHFKKFPFDSTKTLRIANGPVKLPNGELLTGNGVQPDITIPAPDIDESKYLEDPYYSPILNPDQRKQVNEAALIQIKEHQIERQAGNHKPFEADTTSPEDAMTPKPITDPALARGIDFLKGVEFLRALRKTGE